MTSPSDIFFSVVIPVHNKAPHVRRSISSVLNQNFADFELLLVDDASTDDSAAEMSSFDDPRIRILHRSQPGPGGYAARNLGINEARARWVAFLDADDRWYPEHLERMHALSNEFVHAGVMGCGYEFVAPGEEGPRRAICPYYRRWSRLGNHYVSYEQYLRREVTGARPIWTSVACIRKQVLQAAGGFPAGRTKRGGDVDTWLRCVAHAGGLAWSAHIGASYYRDSVNMVTKSVWSDASHQRNTIAHMLATEKNPRIRRLLKRFANRRTIGVWIQNRSLAHRPNFPLVGSLYLSLGTVIDLLAPLLTYLPRNAVRVFRGRWTSRIRGNSGS